MDTNIILAIVQVMAVAITPFIIWFIGIHYQNRKAKEDAKRQLFFTLMSNRKNSVIPKERVEALNLIDVVFQDEDKVRKAWKEYLDALNAKSPNYDNNNAFLLDLLSEMAISLGYKKLRQTEIDRFYEPVQFGNDRKTQELCTNEFIRILKASKSFSEPIISEDEHNSI